VLGMATPYTVRVDRARALYEQFVSISPDWRVEERPFNRPQADPALTIALVAVTSEGNLAPPSHRRLWAHVLRGDESPALSFDPGEAAQVTLDADDGPADAAWLVSRIHRAPAVVARRRLEVVLFAQRTLADATDDAACATALRAFIAYPALALSLERMGLASPDTITRAAARARSLNAVGDANARETAIRQFQALTGILDRAARLGGLDRRETGLQIASLLAVEPSERGYEGRLSQWIRGDLARRLLPPPGGTPSAGPLETSLLAVMAGVRANQPDGPVIQWEGRPYRVDPARAEIARLLQVRRKQEGASLDAAVDAAIAAMSGETDGAAGEHARSLGQRRQALTKADRELADTLTSIVYAAYLGDPEGSALAAGENLALRHDLEGNTYSSANAWRLPYEDSGRKGRHVSGSLLGLDVALGPLALRRIDSSSMPPEPLMSRTDRMNAVHTVAFATPAALSDAARDEIAAALARGRTRLASMSAGRDDVERVAREAGLSEWRRESLAWTLAHDRDAVPMQLSLVELLWLGAPRPSERARLDGWGAGVLALRGCMCLEMPKAQPWEDLAGHAPLGILPSRGADVMLRIADALATLQLPATLAPAIASYAMQDVIDGAQPAYPDEWRAFSRAVLDLTNDRVADYIAALTAGGPLLRVQDSRGHP
jgi:hypothetical protein